MENAILNPAKLQQDVTILYQGGSGGFMLYYYLLLTGRYTTGIKNDVSVQELVQQQFPDQLRQDRRQWKQREFWPDNVWAKQHLAGPRLYLICNPFFDKHAAEINTTVANGTLKILLWTDLRSQVRMAWEKQAWWFTTVSRARYQTGTDLQYLRWMLSQGCADPDVYRIQAVYQPEVTVRLQDFLADPGSLGLGHSRAQQDFILHWMSLQSPRTQQLLKIQSSANL